MWSNLGADRSASAIAAVTASPVALDEPGVAFADMEAMAPPTDYARPLTGRLLSAPPEGGFARPVFWRRPATRLAQQHGPAGLSQRRGVVDLLDTNENFFRFIIATPARLAHRRKPFRAHKPRRFHLPTLRVRLADINGDGLQDLVRVDGAGLVYWPYLGNGRWAEKVSVSNPPDLPRQFEPRRLFVVDIDGDGCADLVYVAFDYVLYWLNQGVRLSDPVKILYTPPARIDEIRIADMREPAPPASLVIGRRQLKSGLPVSGLHRRQQPLPLTH